MPDCVGLSIDNAIDTIRQISKEMTITIRPTFDPKFKGQIHMSSMIVVRQRMEENEIELIVVSI